MKKTNVKFFLGSNYFESHLHSQGVHYSTCVPVLNRAFGVRDWRQMFNCFGNGFHIICTTDQFARFIVHLNGLGNRARGLSDLEPTLHEPVVDPYTKIAQVAGVPRDVVKKVIMAGAYTAGVIFPPADEINVTEED